MKKTIDVITSAFNEEACLPELIKRFDAVAKEEQDYIFRFIIIDNGSSDQSWPIIKNVQQIDKRFVAIKMSRNFTFDAALTCGLDYANSDIAIVMTSDLQDPPEAIHIMLREFEKGYDQVLAKVIKRGSVPRLRRSLSNVFYKLASLMTGGMIPESVSDFRLLTKRCYKAILSMRESHRFLRGLGSWVGFKTIEVEIERPPRFAGQSKWLKTSLVRVVIHGFQSIFAYSSLPLAWVAIFGVLTSISSFMALSAMVILWLSFGVPFAGFGTIVALIVFFFSITILVLGILAQYIGLIYEEVKKRPLYVIEEVLLGDFT
jgi:dolichol-phosphate mannosyltransferase